MMTDSESIPCNVRIVSQTGDETREFTFHGSLEYAKNAFDVVYTDGQNQTELRFSHRVLEMVRTGDVSLCAQFRLRYETSFILFYNDSRGIFPIRTSEIKTAFKPGQIQCALRYAVGSGEDAMSFYLQIFIDFSEEK